MLIFHDGGRERLKASALIWLNFTFWCSKMELRVGKSIDLIGRSEVGRFETYT